LHSFGPMASSRAALTRPGASDLSQDIGVVNKDT
jgi:hypothetical protein